MNGLCQFWERRWSLLPCPSHASAAGAGATVHPQTEAVGMVSNKQYEAGSPMMARSLPRALDELVCVHGKVFMFKELAMLCLQSVTAELSLDRATQKKTQREERLSS